MLNFTLSDYWIDLILGLELSIEPCLKLIPFVSVSASRPAGQAPLGPRR